MVSFQKQSVTAVTAVAALAVNVESEVAGGSSWMPGKHILNCFYIFFLIIKILKILSPQNCICTQDKSLYFICIYDLYFLTPVLARHFKYVFSFRLTKCF